MTGFVLLRRRGREERSAKGGVSVADKRRVTQARGVLMVGDHVEGGGISFSLLTLSGGLRLRGDPVGMLVSLLLLVVC